VTDYLVRILSRCGTAPATVALGRGEFVELAAKREKADVLRELGPERYEVGGEDLERILLEMGEEKPPGES